ncbi:hypothetical protein MRX96_004808 [Rhipicephalus microplus]
MLIKCEVDEVLSVSPLSISLTRCALIGGSRSDLTIFGVLDTEHKERMTVFYRGDLVYYDLRMRDSALHRRLHPACLAYFRRVIGNQRVTSVFNPQCPELLRQRK